jgi:hypothetical protein
LIQKMIKTEFKENFNHLQEFEFQPT